MTCSMIFGTVGFAAENELTPESIEAEYGTIVDSEPMEGSTYGVIAEIESGKLLGRNEDGVYIFKGIPYAHAERFEMPEKPEPWDDLLNANYVGPVAPQIGGSGEYLSNPAYWRVDDTEENMLNLNVWTKDMEPETAKPVIVWMHGGGYQSGSSAELLQYDGKNIADDGDVVFVSVNHRLNYLGYLDLSAYGEEYQYSGNLGHADLIMALEWVRDNISQFGGDPENVTIVGQSGGSVKVCQLMAMPEAKGLFDKVFAMSSGSYEFTKTKEEAQAETAVLVENLGLSDSSNEEIIEYLKNMPYEELAAACEEAGVSTGTVCDNEYVLPDISYSAGDVELIVGTVQAEFSGNSSAMGPNGSYRNGTIIKSEDNYYYNNKMYVTEQDVIDRYVERFGEDAEAAMAAFHKAYPDHDLFDGLYTASRSNHVAEAYTEAGGTAYQYVMAYDLPLFSGVTSWHTGGDIAFLFRNVDSIHSWVAGDEEAADKVSQDFAGALISFAYTGNPSQENLEWPAFTEENGETMIFDRTSEVRNYHDREFQEILAAQQD